jgi:hypothetical protein
MGGEARAGVRRGGVVSVNATYRPLTGVATIEPCYARNLEANLHHRW